MFFNTGTDGITRDENGEVVRDARGNIRGGAFVRYRKGVAEDDLMHWEDFNFRQWGSSEKHRNNRMLYKGKLFKGGNGYDAMEADMNFYFSNSRSPKRTKNIFGDRRGT